MMFARVAFPAAPLTLLGLIMVTAPAAADPAAAADADADADADAVAAAGPAPATADRVELAIGPAFRASHGNSVEALDAGWMAGVALQAAIPIDRIRIPGFAVQLEAALEITDSEGTTFQTLRSETSLGSLSLGVGLRRSLSSRWTASGRAALGAARISVTLQDMASDAGAIGDRAWAGSAYLGGAIDAVLIRREHVFDRFSLGLRIEAGYSAITPVHMDGVPEDRGGDEDAIRIPATTTSLGGLYLGAWTTRVAAVGRF